MDAVQKPLILLNLSVFLKSHLFLLPVLFLFYQECGISLADFFLFQGIQSLVCMILEIPTGYWADRFSKKKILIFSGILLIIRFALLYFVPHYWTIFASEMIFAVVITTFAGTSDSYIYEWLKLNNKTTAMLKRYGKMYFYIALGMGISSLSGAFLFEHYGAQTVILLSMVYVSLSTLVLCFLPELPNVNTNVHGLRMQYAHLLHIIRRTFHHQEVFYLMMFSAFLTAAYQIFQWSFQPLMKQVLFPISLFGFIFFLNNVCRGLGSFIAHRVAKLISMEHVGIAVYVCFILSFIFAVLMVNSQAFPIHLGVLIFICLCIGGQVVFSVMEISRLHDLAKSDERATWSSVNTLYARCATALCLLFSKVILDDVALQTNLIIFGILFLLTAFPLYRFIRIRRGS